MFILDNPKALNKENTFSFNALLMTGEGTKKEANVEGIFFRGLRVMGGVLQPISSRMGYGKEVRYIDVVFLPEDLARALYRELQETGWPEEYNFTLIDDEEIAIANLVSSRKEMITSMTNNWRLLKK